MKTLEQQLEEQSNEIKKLQAVVNHLNKKLMVVEQVARRTEGQNRMLTEHVRVLKNRVGDKV